MSMQTDPKRLPIFVEDVALINAGTCASIGSVSVSYWYSQVKSGRAPAPVRKGNRFTRWSLSQVKQYWASQAQSHTAEE